MGETAMLDSGQQHLRALEYANRVRLARAALKRRVKAGQLSAADVVTSCPWEAHSMSISDLLTSQQGWGGTRCQRMLRRIGVAENKAIGALTERQRLALVAALRSKGGAAARGSRARTLSAV